MNRVFHALLVVLCFEMGALLLYLPWSGFWDQNYFLSHFPTLIPILLHPSFRGVVSGIGILDILLAFNLISNRRPAVSSTIPQRPPS
jgi:hypothetical protein